MEYRFLRFLNGSEQHTAEQHLLETAKLADRRALTLLHRLDVVLLNFTLHCFSQS